MINNSKNKYGYACINMKLAYPQEFDDQPKDVERIYTGRTMIKRIFERDGVDRASELTLANVKDLDKIMDWNILNGFDFYRMTSGIAPWKSEYAWTDLKDLDNIKVYLRSIGVKATTHRVRVTTHPGPFNVLTSPRESVVENCIKDLSEHGDLFDFMGFGHTPYNKINIHLGGAYGDKEAAMDRFCKNFEKLPSNVKSRLTVENDDKASMYSVQDLYDGIYKRIGIPIVFDYHHHRFCDGGLSEREAFELATSTWGDITPVVHYSESMAKEQNNAKIKPQAHSNLVYDRINTYDKQVDVMIEAKYKELAVEHYLHKYGESL